MLTVHGGFPDPRDIAPVAPSPQAAHWYARIEVSLAATSRRAHADTGGDLREELDVAWRQNPGLVDNAIQRAPSVDIRRHLWRTVDELWLTAGVADPSSLQVTAFALPIVVIAGSTAGAETMLDAQLSDPGTINALLREGKALGGSETIATSGVLVPAARLGVMHLPAWDALRQWPGNDAPLAAPGVQALFGSAPLRVLAAGEQAHLRFLVGTAIAAGGRDLLKDASVERWGAGLARELARQLAAPGVTVLALPRPPARPLPAQYQGLVAQREIGAQLFATNAIRRFRASVGEPSAVISSHHAPDAPGGGELRLSLSSPFEPHDAEGFRCPVFGIETVRVPLQMLLDLLHDCRIDDVRLLAGVHPDRLAGTEMPLFFRADAIPDGALLQ